MFDATSALYLGFQHPSASLTPWRALTLGRPAALSEPPGAERVAARLARLQGCEAAVLMPSSLHVFWDLFGMLGRERAAFFVDDATYPILRWGVQRAALLGAPVSLFASGDTRGLQRLLERARPLERPPVVVADALRPGSAEQPPIAAYAALATRYGGRLVLDDTQALGVLGAQPSADSPYGHGGGGSLRHANVCGPGLVVGASLAKAFGAPVAVLSGSRAVIRRFERASEARVHASPPSVAVVHAAERALTLNEQIGERLRHALWRRVRHFKKRLAELGLRSAGGTFPVQSLAPIAGVDAAALQRTLWTEQVRALLLCDGRAGSKLSFVLNATHAMAELDRALSTLRGVLSALTRALPNSRPTPSAWSAHDHSPAI